MKIQMIANENEISADWKPLQTKFNRMEVTSKGCFTVITREKEWSTKGRVARAALGILLGFTIIAFCFDSYWNLFSKNRVKEFWIPLNKLTPSPMPQVPQMKSFQPQPMPIPAIPKLHPFNPQPVQVNKQPIHVNPSQSVPKQTIAKMQIQPQIGEYEKFVKSKNGTPLTRNQAHSAIKIYANALDDEYKCLSSLSIKINLLMSHQNHLETNEELKALDILTDQEIKLDLAKEQELKKEVEQLKKELNDAHNFRMESENKHTFDSKNIVEIVCKLAAIESGYHFLDI
jgi:hypothetical protein